jgi:hypothetical protein
MVDFHRRDSSLPSAREIFERVVEATFDGSTGSPRLAELRRVTQRVVAEQIMSLVVASEASPEVRSRAFAALHDIAERVSSKRSDPSGDDAEAAHRQLLAADISSFFESASTARAVVPTHLEPPPGSPIGAPSTQQSTKQSAKPSAWLGTTAEIGIECSWTDKRNGIPR